MKKQTVNLEAFVEVAARNKELTDANEKLLQRAKDAEDYVTALQDKFDKVESQAKSSAEFNRHLRDKNKMLEFRIEVLEKELDAPKPGTELEQLIGRMVKDEVDSIVEKNRREHHEKMKERMDRKRLADRGRRDRQSW
ncbi:hypothetical protein [Peribacillus muralis]|uniref:hypothetical protein n=1 Tax=Peribacillus muralis TaxID=264697 RepID=UPI00366EA0AB